MKITVCFCLFLCANLIIRAQEINSLITTGTNDYKIPMSETYSTGSLARYIMANHKTDKEKIRAIFNWVTQNIKYDSDSMYVINLGSDPDARISTALRRRKGVCENFAAIFNDIAVKCNIRSYEVNGYTRQSGIVDKASHTWCVVYLDDQWLFCDPTWDAGMNEHPNYFLINPSIFIESHMPFDPIWQLLDHTVSHRDFFYGNFHYRKPPSHINFSDSINAFTRQDYLTQLESAAYRINQAGIYNELIKTRLAWVQMEISMIYQEKNMNLYNAAVNEFNNANNLLNIFIRYRNDRFIPLKPLTEINAMLLPLDSIVSSALDKLVEIDNSTANFQYDTGLLKTRLTHISINIAEHKIFLKRYFSTAVSEREKLFYK